LFISPDINVRVRDGHLDLSSLHRLLLDENLDVLSTRYESILNRIGKRVVLGSDGKTMYKTGRDLEYSPAVVSHKRTLYKTGRRPDSP